MLAKRYPEDPMRVMHRVFAAIGVVPMIASTKFRAT